ncbi:MAG: class IV adenylate cyclase, partial [Hydrogenophaga sp.]|nr:class IV adenylate cyclase [Hydrogenophaga sp.]
FNIEIKAAYRTENFDLAHEKARILGAAYVGCDHQIDTYFNTQEGRFKLRESSISGAYLIPYVRPNTAEAKKSSYVLIPVAAGDVIKTKELFAALLGIETIVEKMREIYVYQNVRIHMDDVVGLGTFFELEAVYQQDTAEQRTHEEEKVTFLLHEFGVAQNDLLQGSYREMAK